MFLLTNAFKDKENIFAFLYKKDSQKFIEIHKEISIPSIHFDSRKIQNQDYFIALEGSRDGHDFIIDAYRNGANGFIIKSAKKEKIFSEIRNIEPEKDLYIILTQDPLQFLQNAANDQRKRFKGIVIGVLGSNGKTSTKDFLYQSLRIIEPNTYATTGNWNNHIGLPLVLLNMPSSTKILVLELGMNHPQEIDLLGQISKPDIALITSIGREHMEFFNSIEDVAKAELEILDHLNHQSTFYYPFNAPLKDYVMQKQKEIGFKSCFFQLNYKNEFINKFNNIFLGKLNQTQIDWNEYKINNTELKHIGLYNNLFLTLLVLHNHFFPNIKKSQLDSILQNLSTIKPLAKQRFEFYHIKNTIIIDDSYNANPDSFISAIDSVINLFGKDHSIACFAGHMAELGNFSYSGHVEVGEYMAKNNIELLAVCGNSDAKFYIEGYQKIRGKIDVPYFENSEILAKKINELIVPINRDSIFLIKGSRSAKMEIVTQKLKEVFENA